MNKNLSEQDETGHFILNRPILQSIRPCETMNEFLFNAFGQVLNPHKSGVLFLGHEQTRRLIWGCTVCLQEFREEKKEIKMNNP